MGIPYMETVVGLIIMRYIFETYLTLRQLTALKRPTFPKSLVGMISQEKFDSLDKRFPSFFAYVYLISGKVLPMLGVDLENEIIHTFSFLAGFWTLYQISCLLFYLYSTFVIKSRHGSNKQTTIWLFIRDMIQDTLFFVIVAPPIISLIIYIVQNYQEVLFLDSRRKLRHPLCLSLPDGDLKKKIEKLASSLKFPQKELCVVQGSERSSRSGGYPYGFLENYRIVLDDTLIQKCKNENEIVAVIAHELGLWKLNHTTYSIFEALILFFWPFGGYTLVRNSTDLFRSFGFDTQPVLIGLIIFLLIGTSLNKLVNFGRNLVSRAFVFQADAFAVKLGYGKHLRAALVKLQDENLLAVNIDPLYSAYHYSHPPLVERLEAIIEMEAVPVGIANGTRTEI